MPCIPPPQLPIPELPLPLTIAPPPLPSIEFDADLCCKIITLDLVPPPIPIPPGAINPAVVAVLRQNLKLVQAFLDKLPPSCPRS